MNNSPMFFGLWGVNFDSLVHATHNRYHLSAADGHDGPVVIFTNAHIPDQGEPVIVQIRRESSGLQTSFAISDGAETVCIVRDERGARS